MSKSKKFDRQVQDATVLIQKKLEQLLAQGMSHEAAIKEISRKEVMDSLRSQLR